MATVAFIARACDEALTATITIAGIACHGCQMC